MIFKLNRKVKKGERNDKMPRQSKSKAIFFLKKVMSDDIMTHFSCQIKLPEGFPNFVNNVRKVDKNKNDFDYPDSRPP